MNPSDERVPLDQGKTAPDKAASGSALHCATSVVPVPPGVSRVQFNGPYQQGMRMRGMIMFDRVPNKEPLQTRLIRHAFAVKAAAAVMFFFAAAWSILQWTLATGPQFSASGLERDFVLIESALCLALAACAFAYLLASAIAWTLTLRALRKGAVPQPRRLPANRPQRRRLAAQG